MLLKIVITILGFLAISCTAQVSVNKCICYLDSKAYFRDGQARFENSFATEPLQVCSHLIYGFAGINKDTYKIESLNPNYDILRNNYREVTNFKLNRPGLRVLLSVGGGRDEQNPEKYLTLLESVDNRQAFVTSAKDFIKTYGFDGLDLAWQFPQNKPKKIRNFWSSAWSTLKHTVVDPSPVDPKSAEHKYQFAALVGELKESFQKDGLLLSLSVLPNVNSSLFHNVQSITYNVDFINLWAFDYYTPKRNPKEADYTAPLNEIIDRKYDENGNYLVQYWLEHGAPSNKLIYGIPTYGRSWKMSHNSGISGVPPISETDGAGDPGPYTGEEGLLSYLEVCSKIINPNNVQKDAVLKKVGDPVGKYGTYAFQPEDVLTKKLGLWVGYEDPETAGVKATYARNRGLGGVAVVDITLDDFRGLCTGNKYPILRAIKFVL